MLPSYVTIDPKSQWHVSGLLCTAMESMTLSSRLKARNGTHEALDQIASVLSVNGNQNIAKLRMSVDQKSVAVLNGQGHDQPGRLEVRAQSRDMRIPSRERSTDAPHITDEDDVATFDMDFFPMEAIEQVRGRQSVKKAHVFGQVENYRGEEDQKSEKANEEEEGRERARRRTAGLPVIQKSVQIFSSVLICPASRIPSYPSFSQNFTLNFLSSSPFVLLTILASAGHGYPCYFLCSIASPAYSPKLVLPRCHYR